MLGRDVLEGDAEEVPFKGRHLPWKLDKLADETQEVVISLGSICDPGEVDKTCALTPRLHDVRSGLAILLIGLRLLIRVGIDCLASEGNGYKRKARNEREIWGGGGGGSDATPLRF